MKQNTVKVCVRDGMGVLPFRSAVVVGDSLTVRLAGFPDRCGVVSWVPPVGSRGLVEVVAPGVVLYVDSAQLEKEGA